jgi:protein-S-isoprenylcysteine O-methyltransferase Ste14
MTTLPDRSGAIVHPPILYVGGLVLGLAAEWVWPLPGFAFGSVARLAAGFALVLVGAAVIAAFLRQFRRAGTNAPVHRPTTALVTDGLYRYSRNPAYLGLTAIYLGLGVAFDSLWVVALAVPVLAAMRYGVIAREEAYLERKFGDAYSRYKARVRRWL